LLAQVLTASAAGDFDLAVGFVNTLLHDYDQHAGLVAHAVCSTAEVLLLDGSLQHVKTAGGLCSRVDCASSLLPIQHKVWTVLLKACALASTSGDEYTYESLELFESSLKHMRATNPSQAHVEDIYGATLMALRIMEARHLNQLGTRVCSIITNFSVQNRHELMHSALYLPILLQGAVFETRLGDTVRAIKCLERASDLLERVSLLDESGELRARRIMSRVFAELGYFRCAERELSTALNLADPRTCAIERLELLFDGVALYAATEQPEKARAQIVGIRRSCLELIPKELRRSITNGEPLAPAILKDDDAQRIRKVVTVLGEVMLKELEHKVDNQPLDPVIPDLCKQLTSISALLSSCSQADSIAQRILIARALASVHNETLASAADLGELEKLSSNEQLGEIGRVQVKLLIAILQLKRGEMYAADQTYDEQHSILLEHHNDRWSRPMLSLLTLAAYFLQQRERFEDLHAIVRRKVELRNELGVANSPGGTRDRDLLASLEGEDSD
jgi:hypothetical protein